MAGGYYLGVDQGTTGTTVLVLDESWNIRGSGYREHTQYYPQPGWVEHNPEEIWQKTQEAIGAALTQAGVSACEVRALGLANQGETCLIWDRHTGRPIYSAIVWQDRRTSEAADRLRESHEATIRRKTGLPVDAYFSGLKFRWVLDHVPGARARAASGELMAGTLDTYLLWKMSGGRIEATDPSTASRTMLFDIHNGQWDDELLSLLDVPRGLLGPVADTAGVFGHTSEDAGFGASIPIAASVVDQPSALFGQACHRAGTVKTTYGTGCFMLMNTGERSVESQRGLVTTVAWRLDGRITYALDGGVYIAGAAVQWLRDGLGIIAKAAETEALARSVSDSGGLYFVPAFSGLAAPYWDQYARGTMVGITGGTNRAHIARATLEAIAYQVRENLDVMHADSETSIQVMRADGGAARNEFLMQFQADMLGIPVDVPVIHETTALGAAYLAALGVGDFKGLNEIGAHWKLHRRYEPGISEDQREALLAGWKRAVERCRGWSRA